MKFIELTLIISTCYMQENTKTWISSFILCMCVQESVTMRRRESLHLHISVDFFRKSMNDSRLRVYALM